MSLEMVFPIHKTMLMRDRHFIDDTLPVAMVFITTKMRMVIMVLQTMV